MNESPLDGSMRVKALTKAESVNSSEDTPSEEPSDKMSDSLPSPWKVYHFEDWWYGKSSIELKKTYYISKEQKYLLLEKNKYSGFVYRLELFSWFIITTVT